VRCESGLLEGSRNRTRRRARRHPRAKLDPNVAPIDPKTNFSAARRQTDVAAKGHQVRGRRVDDANVGLCLGTKADAALPPKGIRQAELAAGQEPRPGFVDTKREPTAGAVTHDEEAQVAAKSANGTYRGHPRAPDANGRKGATARDEGNFAADFDSY